MPTPAHPGSPTASSNASPHQNKHFARSAIRRRARCLSPDFFATLVSQPPHLCLGSVTGAATTAPVSSRLIHACSSSWIRRVPVDEPFQSWFCVSTATKSKAVRLGWYFRFFLTSGFCGILYELVWLGLAMAQSALASVRPSPIQKLSHHFSRDHASA